MLGVCWTSWIFGSIVFPEFGKISTIISLNNFSTPPCLHSYRVIVAFFNTASANLNICDSFSVINWSMLSSSWLCFPFCLLWLNAGHCGFNLGYKVFLFSYKLYWSLLWDAVNYFLIIIIIILWMCWVFFAVCWLSLIATTGAYSLVVVHGLLIMVALSYCGTWALGSVGFSSYCVWAQ